MQPILRNEALKDPWLVAVWPGMGGVAMSAGFYLMARLGMHLLLEFPAAEFFDIDQIEVKNGHVLTRRLPRSRLFLWKDPKGRHDLIVFIGEAQPPAKGGAFCRALIDQAKALGVTRVFTFAAMASQMRPKHDSRVFGAAIDRETFSQFKQLSIPPLESGSINGLNGVLLGIAAADGLAGGCLLGEIPSIFSQIPFPKASLAVLEFFTVLAGIEIDLEKLRAHAATVEQTLEDFLIRMEDCAEETESLAKGEFNDERPGSVESKKIETLFGEARKDRSRAYDLKQELDRVGLFTVFKDRFLDLFKEP